jgi:hypothetical protein
MQLGSSDYCRSIRRFGAFVTSWKKIYLVGSVRVKIRASHRTDAPRSFGDTPDRSAIIDEKFTDRLTVPVDVAIKQA